VESNKCKPRLYSGTNPTCPFWISVISFCLKLVRRVLDNSEGRMVLNVGRGVRGSLKSSCKYCYVYCIPYVHVVSTSFL
jgi:hypothetical protein